MASAILRAWASDSMTQGPATRKSRPAPTCTGPISKELLTNVIVNAGVSGQPTLRAESEQSAHVAGVRGGFFLMKKPLEGRASGYTCSNSAVAQIQKHAKDEPR